VKLVRSALSVVFVAGVAAPAAAQTSTEAPPPPDLTRFLPADGSAEDGRRTLGALPANLGRSFVGLVARENVAPLALGAGLAAGSTFFDSGAQRYALGPGADMRTLGEVGGKAGGFGVVAPLTAGLFVAGRLSGPGSFRAATYDMTQAIIVTGVTTHVLKTTAHRLRPDGSNELSFPSGHTSTAFAWATVANHHWGLKVGIPSYLVAGAIGASRIQGNKHYLSDVLAGATLGYVVGRTVVRENGGAPGRSTRVTVVPASDARGTGVGAGVNVTW
jgi:membrane-associated phospholipid phosphatase